jgi:hypothetical protein
MVQVIEKVGLWEADVKGRLELSMMSGRLGEGLDSPS